MLDSEVVQAVRERKDRDDIHHTMLGYLRGCDRAEWDLVRRAYHPDAEHDHGSYAGDVEGLIDWIKVMQAPMRTVMHTLGNMNIELNGDVAVAESYLVAYMETTGEGGDREFFQVGSRSIDRWERRNGEWRIAKRLVPMVFSRRSPLEDEEPLVEGSMLDSRTAADVLWQMRAEAGFE
jgi:hypothetical protein